MIAHRLNLCFVEEEQPLYFMFARSCDKNTAVYGYYFRKMFTKKPKEATEKGFLY